MIVSFWAVEQKRNTSTFVRNKDIYVRQTCLPLTEINFVLEKFIFIKTPTDLGLRLGSLLDEDTFYLQDQVLQGR